MGSQTIHRKQSLTTHIEAFDKNFKTLKFFKEKRWCKIYFESSPEGIPKGILLTNTQEATIPEVCIPFTFSSLLDYLILNVFND